MQERPPVAALFAEPNPEKVLAGFAAITAAINVRSNDIYRILSSAAGSDAAAATLLVDYRLYASEWGERVRSRDGVGRSGQVTPPAWRSTRSR